MITVAITGLSFAEIHEQIKNLSNELIGAPWRARTSDLLIRNQSSDQTEIKKPLDNVSLETTVNTGKRGRPKKNSGPKTPELSAVTENVATPLTNEPHVPEVANEETKVAVSPPAGKLLTRDDIYKALVSVTETKGLEVAAEILKEFNAERISAVSEQDFDAFVAKCKQTAGIT